MLKWPTLRKGTGLIAAKICGLLSFVAFANPSQLPRATNTGAAECAREEQLLREYAERGWIDVQSSAAVRVTEAIELHWSLGSDAPPPTQLSYLILTMPETVRFEGSGFFIIPPGAPSPGNIKYGSQQLRLFFPLHLPLHVQNSPRLGRLKIKPYRAGQFALSYAFVSATGCGEKLLRKGEQTTLLVLPGEAEVVIQDLFSSEKPEKVIFSNSGQYRLEIFKDSYRVFDLETGAKIVERAGYDANFSPASRYIVARLPGYQYLWFSRFEIVDLVSANPVSWNEKVIGNTIGWALGDALFIEGMEAYGELRIRQSYVDDEAAPAPKDAVRGRTPPCSSV